MGQKLQVAVTTQGISHVFSIKRESEIERVAIRVFIPSHFQIEKTRRILWFVLPMRNYPRVLACQKQLISPATSTFKYSNLYALGQEASLNVSCQFQTESLQVYTKKETALRNSLRN